MRSYAFRLIAGLGDSTIEPSTVLHEKWEGALASMRDLQACLDKHFRTFSLGIEFVELDGRHVVANSEQVVHFINTREGALTEVGNRIDQLEAERKETTDVAE